MMKIFLGVAFLALGTFSTAIPPPKYITSCHTKDPNFKACALEKANKALPDLVKGDKKFKIPPLNPLKLSLVDLKQSGIEINFRDLTIYGLSEATVKDIDFTKNQIRLVLHVDNLQIVGQYTSQGKVSVIPLVGKGPCNITAVDGDYILTTTLSQTNVDGVPHLKFVKTDMDLQLKRAYFKLENLLKDQNLGIDANQLLNDNWEAVINDLGGAIKETVTVIYNQIISTLLEKVAMKDILPD